MKRKVNNLEAIFQSAFKQHSEIPSSKVLRHLKSRLWISNFFSLNMNKANIVYAATFVGIIISSLLYLNRNSDETIEIQSHSSSPEITTIASDTPVSDDAPVIENSKYKNDKEMLSAFFDAKNIKGCVPLKVQFNNQSKYADNYKWDFGNGESSIKQSPYYIYSKPGLYLATLTITNNKGQSDTYSKNIHVFKNPVADGIIDIKNSDNANKKVLFINKSKESISYLWSFGDNKTANTQDPSHIYENYGIYHVKLIAISKNGCNDTVKLENRFLLNNYQLFFPYTFKPNTADKGNNGFYEQNSGQNAVFYPKNYGADEYQLSIKTNSGIEVFYTKNIHQGWNGYVRGMLAPGGTYSYLAKGIYPNGKSFYIEGKVKVIIDDYFQD